MRPFKQTVLEFYSETTKNGERFLQALDDFKALTRNEAARILNIRPEHMQQVIYILRTKEAIHQVDVWRNPRKAKYKLFQWYAGKRLYFIDKERLRQWVIMQVPPHEKTSKRFQRILRNRVRKNFDVNLEA